MKNIKILTTIFAAMLLLTACHKDDADYTLKVGDKFAILTLNKPLTGDKIYVKYSNPDILKMEKVYSSTIPDGYELINTETGVSYYEEGLLGGDPCEQLRLVFTGLKKGFTKVTVINGGGVEHPNIVSYGSYNTVIHFTVRVEE